MLLLGYKPYVAAQTLKVVTVAIAREPRLHSNPFITKKQLYPQAGFSGNKNYKLVVLPLFAFRTLQVFLVQRDNSS